MTLRLTLLASTAVLFFASACSSIPAPNEAIGNADMALRLAEQAGATEYAPLPMRIAREKLDEAKALVQKGGDEQMTEARQLAEEALVEAQLAEQTARTAVAEKSRDQAQQTIDAMRRETDRVSK